MKQNNSEKIGAREQWRNFINLLRKARVPWYLYILTFIMNAVGATLFVKVPIILGELMQGDIFDAGKITQYGVLATLEILFRFGSMVLFVWVSMKIASNTAVGIWRKILHLPMGRLDREGPSRLTSRVTRDNDFVDYAVSGIFNSLSVIYGLVLIYIEMFKLHAGMTVVFLVVPVWTIVSMVLVGNLNYETQRRVTNALSALTSYLSVRLPNMCTIKAFGTQQQEQAAGRDYVDGLYHANVRRVQVDALSSVLQELANAVSNIVVIAYGAYLVGSGQMELGNFVTIFLFVTEGNLIWNSQDLIMYYLNIKFGMGGSSKISQLINTEEEQLRRDKSFTVPEADIVFDHVSFGYGDETVLRDVSLTIPAGKTTAIVGANGSGKTTILRLLERLYTPTEGRITYGGEDIERYHLTDWRGSLGYVVQNSPLLIGTVMDNICYGLKTSDKAAAEAAAREVGAWDFVMAMEQGFDSDIGEMGGHLSGGQRQKLSIARVLVKKPDMYLLDEATSGLDACNEKEITELMNSLLKGKTAVVVAHNLETIRRADQIVVLQDGSVLATGTHDALLEKSELYRRFCGLSRTGV